jgi:hypothetical protein
VWFGRLEWPEGVSMAQTSLPLLHISQFQWISDHFDMLYMTLVSNNAAQPCLWRSTIKLIKRQRPDMSSNLKITFGSPSLQSAQLFHVRRIKISTQGGYQTFLSKPPRDTDTMSWKRSDTAMLRDGILHSERVGMELHCRGVDMKMSWAARYDSTSQV